MSHEIDQATLDTLKEVGGNAFLQSVIEAFEQDAAPLMTQLKAGISGGDAEVVSHAAHALKGSSQNLGLTLVGSLSATIEQNAKAANLTDAPQHLAELEAALESARLFFAKMGLG